MNAMSGALLKCALLFHRTLTVDLSGLNSIKSAKFADAFGARFPPRPTFTH
jgi:hypothetical protein